MPLHEDFQKLLESFKEQYGAEKGERVFWAYINKHGLDETKPLGPQLHQKKEEAYEDEEAVEALVRYEVKYDACMQMYTTKEGRFKEGFTGCVEAFKQCKGLPEDSARRLCGYIYHYVRKRKGEDEEEENDTKPTISKTIPILDEDMLTAREPTEPSMMPFTGTPFILEDKPAVWTLYILSPFKSEVLEKIYDFEIPLDKGVVAITGAYYDEHGDKFDRLVALEFKKEDFPDKESIQKWIITNFDNLTFDDLVVGKKFEASHVALVGECLHTKVIEDLGPLLIVACRKSKKPIAIYVDKNLRDYKGFAFACAREINVYMQGGFFIPPTLKNYCLTLVRPYVWLRRESSSR